MLCCNQNVRSHTIPSMRFCGAEKKVDSLSPDQGLVVRYDQSNQKREENAIKNMYTAPHCEDNTELKETPLSSSAFRLAEKKYQRHLTQVPKLKWVKSVSVSMSMSMRIKY